MDKNGIGIRKDGIENRVRGKNQRKLTPHACNGLLFP